MNKVERINRLIVILKNKNLHAAVFFILILATFYRDVVFQGRTFLMETAAAGTMPGEGPYKYEGVSPGFVANDPGAIAWQIEPFNRFLSKSIKRGDFPLWNPYAGLAGSPLLADGHTGPLEPLQFLFFFIPDRYWPYAVDTQLLMRFFLAGFFCYLFARRLKIDFVGSISAGVLFMLSIYFVTFGNHPQIKTEALLPLVLYGYDRLADNEDTLGFWFCALFISWAIVAAMPEATFFSLFLGMLWYFYKSIFVKKKDYSILKRVKLVSIHYAGSTALGFLISAAYLLPFLEYVSLSTTVHSTSHGVDEVVSSLPLWSIFSVILQVNQRYFVKFGIFTLFILVFSFFRFKDESKFRPAIIFFSLYATFFILAIFNFPFTAWFHRLPVFDRIVFYKYPIPSIAFCLALLSGIFVDETHTKLSYKQISISLLILELFFLVLPRLNDPEKFWAYLPDKSVIYITLYITGGVSFLLYYLAFLNKDTRLKHHPSQVVLLLILIAEPFYWGSQVKRPDRYDPYFQHVPAFISYLKDDREIYRTFSMSGILYPNISTAYKIFDVRWLNALVPRRAYDFTVRFITPEEPKTMRFTGTSYPISDRMFDLLNVKYVLGWNAGVCQSERRISQPNFFSQGLDVKKLVINNSVRDVILAYPPSKFERTIAIPAEAPSSFDFSIGLNPIAFQQPNRGDGVGFTITILDIDNKDESPLYIKYIDPKNDPCARRWFDESISLDRWAGKKVVLKFSTNAGPAGNTNWDWAYWGNIRLSTGQKSQPAEQTPQEEPLLELPYEPVYEDKKVEIYQNRDVYPRAFVVYDIVNSLDFNEVLDLLDDPRLDLRQTAVVENLPVEMENLINENDWQMRSVAGITKLASSGMLEVKVNTKAPGLLIVTDQYYPGWQAFIDGKMTTIYAVDGLFRGVFLEEGTHTVQFKYRPLSFIIGIVISSLSLLVTSIFILSNFKALPNKHE